MRRGEPEHQEQCALIYWAGMASFPPEYPDVAAEHIGDYLAAIPNGGDRHPAVAAKLKAEGVKKGVSDLILAFPAHGYHGLWIEMKAKGGSANKDQKEWIAKMRRRGYAAAVCVGWHAAASLIGRYLKGLEV